MGQPAVRLGRHAGDGWLVDTAYRRRGKAVRRAAYRPFPRAGELLAVPYGDTTARNGQWVKGPGMDLIDRLERAGFPSWSSSPRIWAIHAGRGPTAAGLRLAGDEGAGICLRPRDSSSYLPHTYQEKLHLLHRHPRQQPADARGARRPSRRHVYAREYLALTEAEGFHWGVLRGGMGSVAMLFVAQRDRKGFGKAR